MPFARIFRPFGVALTHGFWTEAMALFHLHDEFAGPAGERRFTFARASAWLAATLKAIHQAIVAAKTRRLQRELMFHTDLGDEALDEPSDRPLGE
ncbi:MAG TPA: hypothetical protein VKB76_00440, partial [Ktedonobacterales bacterium]|nr:hypothetical protein [Ktedonobacterales bacterium]